MLSSASANLKSVHVVNIGSELLLVVIGVGASGCGILKQKHEYMHLRVPVFSSLRC